MKTIRNSAKHKNDKLPLLQKAAYSSTITQFLFKNLALMEVSVDAIANTTADTEG